MKRKKIYVSKLAALPRDPSFNAVFIFATKVGASVSANYSRNVFISNWAEFTKQMQKYLHAQNSNYRRNENRLSLLVIWLQVTNIRRQIVPQTYFFYMKVVKLIHETNCVYENFLTVLFKKLQNLSADFVRRNTNPLEILTFSLKSCNFANNYFYYTKSANSRSGKKPVNY